MFFLAWDVFFSGGVGKLNEMECPIWIVQHKFSNDEAGQVAGERSVCLQLLHV